MAGFRLTTVERQQLIAFLGALTDDSFIQRAIDEGSRRSR